MAVGSAFDAYVKNALYVALHGSAEGTEFDREKIFLTQVEEHIRQEIRPLAEDLFQQYIDTGAYDSLLAEVVAGTEVAMEFTRTGEVGGVPLLGKPDLRFVTRCGLHVITDWKVNGSMSKTGASPQVGYRICHDYGSNTHLQAHKRFEGVKVGSVLVSKIPMCQTTEYWAGQLAMYGWLCGEPVGSQDFIVRIEQIACRPVKSRDLPRAKFAQHVARVSPEYQQSLLERLQRCWEACETGHVFTDMSKEANDAYLYDLDNRPSDPSALFGQPLEMCFE